MRLSGPRDRKRIVDTPGRQTFDVFPKKSGMDAFNFFNHTNLTGLVTTINNTFFSQLQNTAGARQFQLNGRLSW